VEVPGTAKAVLSLLVIDTSGLGVRVSESVAVLSAGVLSP